MKKFQSKGRNILILKKMINYAYFFATVKELLINHKEEAIINSRLLINYNCEGII